MPEEKQFAFSCEEWLNAVIRTKPGGVLTTAGKEMSSRLIPTDGDNSIFPLKILEGLLLEACIGCG